MLSNLMNLSATIFFQIFSPIGLIPLEWNPEKKILSVTKKKWKFRTWFVGAVINFLQLCWVILRLMYLHNTADSSQLPVAEMILLACSSCFLLLSTIANISLCKDNFQDMANLVTAMYTLDDLWEAQPDMRSHQHKTKLDLFGVISCCIVPMEILISVFISIAGAVMQSQLIWTETPEINYWKILITSCFAIYYFLVALTFVAPASMYLLMGSLYVRLAVMWTKKMTLHPNTISHLQLAQILQSHQALYIGSFCINRHCDLMTPLLIVVAQGVSVCSIYGSIKLLHMTGGLLFPALGVILLILAIFLLQQTGIVVSYSEDFLYKCRRNENESIRRKARAVRPVCITVGSAGYIDKSFILTFMTYVIDNTQNVLIALNKV